MNQSKLLQTETPFEDLTVTEAARLLSCSRKHVYSLMAKGLLESYSIGLGRKPARRIRRESLENLRQRQPGQGVQL